MKKSNLESKLEISGIVLLIFIFFFARQAEAGLVLGLLSTVCMAMTYAALPITVKKLICKFRVTVDLALAFIVPLWFGNFTAIALYGAAVNSILVSILLNEENRKFERMKLI